MVCYYWLVENVFHELSTKNMFLASGFLEWMFYRQVWWVVRISSVGLEFRYIYRLESTTGETIIYNYMLYVLYMCVYNLDLLFIVYLYCIYVSIIYIYIYICIYIYYLYQICTYNIDLCVMYIYCIYINYIYIISVNIYMIKIWLKVVIQ